MASNDQKPQATDVDEELNKARDSLRRLDDDIRQLTGRNAEEIGRFGKGRNRFSTDGGGREDNGNFRRGARWSQTEADRGGAGGIGQKRRITYGDRGRSYNEEAGNGEDWKRPRIASEYSRGPRFVSDSTESDARVVKPSVQSSVTMPLKEVKSRDAAITELKGVEKREMAVRNRRMFGVLMGTLKQFKKEEEKHGFKDQEKKQKEIESRLEDTKRKERAEMEKERQKLLDKRRRQEQDVRRLQRKKALIAATDNQIALLRRLQNFIQTTTKPQIFFMPAKHTFRTIEMQKKSHKQLEETIKKKQEETEAQLKDMDDGLATAPLDDEDDEQEDTFQNESSHLSEPSDEKLELEQSSGVNTADESAIVVDTAFGDGEGEGETEQLKSEDYPEPRDEPPKPKDIIDELKELTAGYAEELNFEDDDQQR